MTEIFNHSKIFKIIDTYENKELFPPFKEQERNGFYQNKMMKFYKIIKNKENPYNSTLFMSDNKGAIYICEFGKDNKSTKIINFDSICNDSKYILIDVIKSSKYDFYFSLDLNPCLNIFKLKDNNKTKQKEIEVLQHINLKNGKNKKNKTKYNKICELNTIIKDYFILFSEDKIELYSNNNKGNKINYERVYVLKYENDNINNDDTLNIKKIGKIFKVDDERVVLFDKNNLQFINIKISESNKKNNNLSFIEIINKININGINDQFESINSLFVDKDYIFLGLFDSLILVYVPYGEIIQRYKIGKVIQMKMTNDKKYIVIFAETNNDEYYFIKYKFIEFNGLEEESRIKYNKWLYKFDVIQNGEMIAIYDVKGLITLLKYDKLN